MTTEDIIYIIAGLLIGTFFIAQTWPHVRDRPSYYGWTKFIGMIILTLMALIFLILGLID
jgi:hypothetical protein